MIFKIDYQLNFRRLAGHECDIAIAHNRWAGRCPVFSFSSQSNSEGDSLMWIPLKYQAQIQDNKLPFTIKLIMLLRQPLGLWIGAEMQIT
jgi:hypothetical protein